MLHSNSNAENVIAIAIPIADSVARQAETDEQFIALWLHGRSNHTIDAYRADVERFRKHIAKTLHVITLGDLQSFADLLATSGLAPASIHRRLSAVKSLIAFGHRLGYLPFDVAKPLRLPRFRDGLADRILDEAEVQRMLALERHPRNHALLLLLYAAGLRVSEACGLQWSDVQAREDGCQITVCGKRNKTRTIVLPAGVWKKVVSLRGEALVDRPIFVSRKKGHLTPTQVWRIVKKAAKRAGIERAVSCHWLRHGHASHALDRGAPIHLVQATLGHASVSTTGRYLHARPTDSSASYLPL
jgi:integrase/recombinase XerD